MDLPKGIEGLKELTRTRAPSTAKRIFDKKKEDLIEDLKASIEQAAGRYVYNNRADPTNPVQLTDDGKPVTDKDGNPVLLNKVSAAPNWRVQMNAKTKSNPNPSPVYVTDEDKGQEFRDEAVFVYMKAGRTKAPLWGDDEGNKRTEKRISSADLVAVLEYMLGQVEGWTEDSADGKILHQVGVVDAIAPITRSKMEGDKTNGIAPIPHAHCMETDSIVPADEVKKASPYSLDFKIKAVMGTKDGLLVPA